MPIIPPNPQDATVPTDSYLVEQAQAEFRALKAYMQGVLAYTVIGGVVSMPGDIIWSAVNTRVGCLPCNGAAVSRTTYAVLFAAIGSTFGAGDGSTTFNVPDFKGRNMIGFDSGNSSGRMTLASTGGISAAAIGNTGGTQNHILTPAELALHSHTATVIDSHHSHTFTGTAHTHTAATHHHAQNNVTILSGTVSVVPVSGTTSSYYANSPATNTADTVVTINNATAAGTNSSDASNIAVTNGSVGNNTPHNIVQPGIVMYPYIKC